MKKIALVLPYFGKFPNYFQLFLDSVGHNSDIDLLLFTDNTDTYEYPANVKLHKISFKSFKELLQSKFDFELSHLQGTYNLCDFKPTYGYCLEGFLGEYDFWGHCDCDLIFGDLREFLTEDVLDRYDKILSGGHLTCYRNDAITNKRFKEKVLGVPYYKDVYTSSPFKIWCFDEWGGVNKIWDTLHKNSQWWPIIYDDVYVAYGSFRSCKNFTDEFNDRFVYHYKNGKMMRCRIDRAVMRVIEEPTCYLHLQKRPMILQASRTDDFMVVPPNKFIDTVELTVANVCELRKGRWFYPHYYSVRLGNLKRKCKYVLSKVR